MPLKPSPIDQLNTLEKINYSQEGFERAAKEIIAKKETPWSIGNTLSEGIKKDPINACKNFYQAIESLKSDPSLRLTPEKEQSLSHLARVIIVEQLASNGYTLSIQDEKYSLLLPNKPNSSFKDSPQILKNIWITDVGEAQKVLTTIEEHKKEYHEILTPKKVPIATIAQAQRQTLALQIDTGSTMAGTENARSIPQGGSFWDSIFWDSNISRNLNENAAPLVGLAAFFGLSKLFGLFDMKFGEGGGKDEHWNEAWHEDKWQKKDSKKQSTETPHKEESEENPDTLHPVTDPPVAPRAEPTNPATDTAPAAPTTTPVAAAAAPAAASASSAAASLAAPTTAPVAPAAPTTAPASASSAAAALASPTPTP